MSIIVMFCLCLIGIFPGHGEKYSQIYKIKGGECAMEWFFFHLIVSALILFVFIRAVAPLIRLFNPIVQIPDFLGNVIVFAIYVFIWELLEHYQIYHHFLTILNHLK